MSKKPFIVMIPEYTYPNYKSLVEELKELHGKDYHISVIETEDIKELNIKF